MTDYREQAVKHWTAHPCGSGAASDALEPGSLAFFEAVSAGRYRSDPWMDRAIDWDMARGKKLLEIGHGMGTDLVRFAQHGADVHGIDITEAHHNLARRNFELRGLPGEFKVCDAAAIDYPDAFFDVVYSHGVLHHVPETEKCVEEAYRVLKPGGVFVMSVYHTFSAFHVFKLLISGIVLLDLVKLGYDGLMAKTERGADGIRYKPLVKTFSKGQVRRLLKGFRTVKLNVFHLKRDHFGCRFLENNLPRWIEPRFEKNLGWYVVATAKK